ncbi:MAG TPA: M48 family metalloprotease [Solirubrobacteraceae bacterium]|nr:M48 family metalloprotease [Solirubrobacteraceae bacterium]
MSGPAHGWVIRQTVAVIAVAVPVAAFGLGGLLAVIAVTSLLALVLARRNTTRLPLMFRAAEKQLKSDRRVSEAVATISARAEMPAPRCGVLPALGGETIRAAAARHPAPGVIVITKPLASDLDGRELNAVVAHELAHIWHPLRGQVAILTLWGLLAGAVTEAGYAVTLFGPHLRAEAFMYSPLAFLAVFVFARPVLALFPLAVSRRGELLADRWACRLGCDELCLATALWEVRADQIAAADRQGRISPALRKRLRTLRSVLRGHRSWTAAHRREALVGLCRSDLATERLLVHLYSTHPSVVERTERLLAQPAGSPPGPPG